MKKENDKEFKSYKDVIRNSKVDLAFDIGANEGQCTKHLLKLGFNVVSIEPEEINYRKLAARFNINNQVKVIKTAVGGKVGKQKLYVSKMHTRHTLNKKALIKSDGTMNKIVSVTTIENLIKRFGKPTLIKIDVEGYEKKILLNMSNPVPQIIFEANLPEFLLETISIIDHLSTIKNSCTFRILQKNEKLYISREVLKNELVNISHPVDLLCSYYD